MAAWLQVENAKNHFWRQFLQSDETSCWVFCWRSGLLRLACFDYMSLSPLLLCSLFLLDQPGYYFYFTSVLSDSSLLCLFLVHSFVSLWFIFMSPLVCTLPVSQAGPLFQHSHSQFLFTSLIPLHWFLLLNPVHFSIPSQCSPASFSLWIPVFVQLWLPVILQVSFIQRLCLSAFGS